MSRPEDLPDFGNPPIDEVAIGLQFPPIDGLIQPHFGLFWSLVRAEYPTVQSVPRLEGPIESLTEPPQPAIFIQVGPTLGRNWYVSADDEMVIQLQDTRFSQNWRRRTGDYPRFEAVKKEFWGSYAKFRELLDAEGLKAPLVQQLELTYINWIPDLSTSAFLRVGSESRVSVPGVGPEPESQDWMARYSIHKDDRPVARLYVQCQQAVRTEGPSIGPGSQFVFVYRAPAPEGMTDDTVEELMDDGRNVIVRMFTDLTTDSAHAHWDRIK